MSGRCQRLSLTGTTTCSGPNVCMYASMFLLGGNIYIALLGLPISAAALGLIFLFLIYYYWLRHWMSSCPLLLLYSPCAVASQVLAPVSNWLNSLTHSPKSKTVTLAFTKAILEKLVVYLYIGQMVYWETGTWLLRLGADDATYLTR